MRYLGPRRTVGVEAVGSEYVRTTSTGLRTVRFAEGELEVAEALGPAEATDTRRRLEALFRSHEEWTAPEAFVADPLLGPLVARVPGFRPLGCWEPFELCLRVIVGQQVSVAAAGTLMERLGRRAGAWTPEAVARADLAGLGMPGRRVATLRTLAVRAAAGELPWDAPWPELREALARLPGVGPWTLGYLGLRLGRDLDAFPSSDLGLLREAECQSPRELEARAEPWRPFRGWAAAYLWMI